MPKGQSLYLLKLDTRILTRTCCSSTSYVLVRVSTYRHYVKRIVGWVTLSHRYNFLLFQSLFSLPSPLGTIHLFLISMSLVTFCLRVCFADQVPLKGKIISVSVGAGQTEQMSGISEAQVGLHVWCFLSLSLWVPFFPSLPQCVCCPVMARPSEITQVALCVIAAE